MATEDAPRRRRGARVAKVALLWLGVSALVLGLVVLLGNVFGANQLPGQKVDAGRTGQEIWARNCAVCHGRDGQGGEGPAFTAGGPLSGLTFDERVARTADGKPLNGMPKWSVQISAEEIRKVAAYTQILSGQQPDPSVEDVR